MSEALEISKYHTSFNEKIPARSLNDLKKTTVDTVKTKYKYFKQRRSITSESTTLGVEHLFSIPTSYSYVSNFSLEMIGTGVSVYDIGVGGICNAIKNVKIEHGSNSLMTYSGNDLYKMIMIANKDDAIKTELVSLMGSGDTDTTPMVVPLLCVGSNLIYGLDSFDARQPAWPIGSVNTPLTIRITLQTGAYISKTNAFELGSLKLRFNSYAVDKDDIANKQPSKLGIYYSWYYMKPIGNEYSKTLTSATEEQFVIDNVITQGELNGIVIDVLNPTKATDMEYQDTEGIDQLAVKIRGTEILYEHYSQVDARLRCMEDWKIKNKFNGSSESYGFFYPCSLTARADISLTNIASVGQNLNLNKPSIYLTCTSLGDTGSAHTIRVLALYKCAYEIRNDKSADDLMYI